MDRQRDMINVLVYLIERGCSSCPIWIRTKLFVDRDRDIHNTFERAAQDKQAVDSVCAQQRRSVIDRL